MDSKERESIVNEAVEKTLLMIPEVVGNLIMNHAAKIRANKKFYEKFPEFKDYKDVVASVIEEVDDEGHTKDLDKIIEKAIPEIKRRIKAVKDLNMKKVEKPDLNIPFGSGEI